MTEKVDLKSSPEPLPRLVDLVRARLRSSRFASVFLLQRLIRGSALPHSHVESFVERTGDYFEPIGVSRQLARKVLLDGLFIYPGRVEAPSGGKDDGIWYLKDSVLLYRMAAEVDSSVLRACLGLFLEKKICGAMDLRVLISDIKRGYEMLGHRDDFEDDPLFRFVRSRLPGILRIGADAVPHGREPGSIVCGSNDEALEILAREICLSGSLTVFCMNSVINGRVATIRDFLDTYWSIRDAIGEEQVRVERISETFCALERRYLPWRRRAEQT